MSRWVVMAVLLVSLPQLARAQDGKLTQPAERPETRAAHAHYRAGLAYFREGDLPRAVEEFIASRQDDPRPELDYNLGLAYDRLGDAAKAADAYLSFLRARPQSDERTTLQMRVAELENKIGELIVTCTPSDSQVTVDHEPLDPTRLGKPLRLTVGTHAVEAHKDGYAPARATVLIIARQRTNEPLVLHVPSLTLSRGAKIGIGIGVTAGVLAIVGVALGVYFGTKAPTPFDPPGGVGVFSVRPIGAQQ